MTMGRRRGSVCWGTRKWDSRQLLGNQSVIGASPMPFGHLVKSRSSGSPQGRGVEPATGSPPPARGAVVRRSRTMFREKETRDDELATEILPRDRDRGL